MKPNLTGFVREVRYLENRKVISVIEGTLSQGEYQGFARVMDLQSPNQIHIKTGFWRTLNGVMAPLGKFQWDRVSADGSVHTVCSPSIYSSVIEGSKIRLLRCQGEPFQDFRHNILPQSVPQVKGKGLFSLCCASAEKPIYLNSD